MMNDPNVTLDNALRELDWRTSDKLCPLPMASGRPPVHCLGHSCARWNPHYGGCSDATLYLTLDYVGHQIARVGDELMQIKEA